MTFSNEVFHMYFRESFLNELDTIGKMKILWPRFSPDFNIACYICNEVILSKLHRLLLANPLAINYLWLMLL